MTRRQRRGRKPQNPQIWFPDDVAQLLSWLDHCIESGDEFESTVQERLRATRKKKYTWDQITTKLRKLWAAFSGKRSVSVTSSELLYQGTICLPSLSKDLKGKINYIKSTLDSGKTFKKPYRLRTTPTAQLGACDDVVKYASQTSSPLSSLGPTPRLTTPSSDATTSVSNSSEPVRPPGSDRSDAASSQFHVPSDSMTSTMTSRSATIYLLRKRLEDNEKHIYQLQKELRGKDNHILRLKIELESEEEELKEIKECLKMRVSSDSDPKALITTLQYSASYLKKQLDHVQSLHASVHSITTRDSTNHFKGSMLKNMYALERDVLNVCTNLQAWLHYKPISRQVLFDHPATIEPLACRAFTTGMLGLQLAFSGDLDTQLDILRVLVIASIFRDVFETAVFDFLSHESALLAKYRECLLLKDGAHQLKIIDWLAHQSLMTESSFREDIVESKAKVFASDLLRCLMKLWPLESTDKSVEYETLLRSLKGDEEDGFLCHPILEQFQELYAHSLRIKVDLLLTGHTFFAEFAEIGTIFTAGSMSKDGYTDCNTPRYKGRKASTKDTYAAIEPEPEIVKLCFFPAIYKLPSAEQTMGTALANAESSQIVKFVNFTTLNKSMVDTSLNTPVCKATVSV